MLLCSAVKHNFLFIVLLVLMEFFTQLLFSRYARNTYCFHFQDQKYIFLVAEKHVGCNSKFQKLVSWVSQNSEKLIRHFLIKQVVQDGEGCTRIQY